MDASGRRAVLAAIPLTGTLCAIGGAVDVIAYLLFGRIFIANMTGNTVLFAASILLHDWRDAALRFGILVAFLAGISVAHAGLRKLVSGRERRGRLVVLAIEFIVLTVLGMAFPTHAIRVLLLVALAIALGTQNNAFHRIGPIRLNTAFITGDLENLGEAIVETEAPGKRREARLRLAIFLTTWIAYALGALLGAYGALHFKDKALWLPAGLVAIAAGIVARSPSQVLQS
ncbi:MAG: YoaK family protein [Acidobacteriaceae bacterium]